MLKKDFTRRGFIKTTSAITAGTLLAPTAAYSASPFDPKELPTTMFGKTGARIPLIVFGAGSRFMAQAEDTGLELLEYALEKGLYYWDTASIYKNETEFSEERIGKILKNRRSEVFLASKLSDRNGDAAKRTVEESLKRLQTDYIDLYQIHSITNEEEVKLFGDKNGVLPVLQKFKEEGVIRNIGFSGHTSAEAMKLTAEMYDFDTMLIALNHMRDRKQKFEEVSIRYAAKKGMGVLAMKVIRPRETVNGLNPNDLVRYALSLEGVTAANIGMDSKEVIDKNIEIIKNFEPLSSEKMKELHVKLQPFYNNKKLPWMQASYYDGMHWA